METKYYGADVVDGKPPEDPFGKFKGQKEKGNVDANGQPLPIATTAHGAGQDFGGFGGFSENYDKPDEAALAQLGAMSPGEAAKAVSGAAIGSPIRAALERWARINHPEVYGAIANGDMTAAREALRGSDPLLSRYAAAASQGAGKDIGINQLTDEELNKYGFENNRYDPNKQYTSQESAADAIRARLGNPTAQVSVTQDANGNWVDATKQTAEQRQGMVDAKNADVLSFSKTHSPAEVAARFGGDAGTGPAPAQAPRPEDFNAAGVITPAYEKALAAFKQPPAPTPAPQNPFQSFTSPQAPPMTAPAIPGPDLTPQVDPFGGFLPKLAPQAPGLPPGDVSAGQGIQEVGSGVDVGQRIPGPDLGGQVDAGQGIQEAGGVAGVLPAGGLSDASFGGQSPIPSAGAGGMRPVSGRTATGLNPMQPRTKARPVRPGAAPTGFDNAIQPTPGGAVPTSY